MKVIADRIVTLGFGKYVRADKIVALVPIEEDRGSGRRTLVYVDDLPEPLVAGRTEGTILRDMVGAESGAAELLRELQLQIGQVRPLLKSSIRSEAGLDLDELSRRITDLTGEPESRGYSRGRLLPPGPPAGRGRSHRLRLVPRDLRRLRLRHHRRDRSLPARGPGVPRLRGPHDAQP